MQKNTSLQSRFNVVLIIVYLSSLLITLSIVYLDARQEMYVQARHRLTLISDMVGAIREYVTQDVRPALLAQHVLHPPAVSSTVASSYIARHFAKQQPDFYLKTASDNPLNPANLVQPIEQSFLNSFRENRQETFIIREGTLNGKQYLFSAQPTLSSNECLLCHGKPETAPPTMRQQYTGSSGFGYRVNEVVGVNVVGVPLENVQTAIFKRSLAITIILTAIFSIMMILINMTVRRQILQPLEDIIESAQAISKGQQLDVPLPTTRADEIGQLTQAIELMRRSFVKAMERMNRKSL